MRLRRTVSLAAAAACLAGCGNAAARSEEDPEAVRTLPPGQHVQVRVGLTEWTIVASPSRVPAGRLNLLVTNTGATMHDLVVRGHLGTWETPDLRPGQQSILVIRADRGETLQLWCSMPGHRSQGMQATLSAS